MTSGHCLVLFLATLFLGSIEIITGQDPQVRSPAGTFRGKVLTAPSGARYESYRGIPYALPPTGERRFAVPEPYPVIEGEYDATDFGPFCVQQVFSTSVGQEDCLYLNVFRPIKQEDTTADSRLKSVYVFIHGGGMVMGSSNIYLPGDLVTRADIVVVTMNYRLGLLGFLYGNSDSLPGNQGLWDQVLALRWVKDNIRSFGGDPDDVTLSGESAGSMSASLLSISPVAKDLFNKALLLSGTSFLFPSPARTSNFLLEMAAENVACGVKTVTGNEEDVVTCLKEQPAESFGFNFSSSIANQFISSGDDLLPRPILQLVDDSEYLRDVGFFSRDYIASLTNDDGYILINSHFVKVDTSSVDSAARDLADFLQIPEYLVRLLLTEYQKLYEGLEKSAISYVNDNFFMKQSLRFLEVYENNPNKERTLNHAYFMSFDHSPRYMQNQYMIHALDLVYLFDMEPKLMELFYLIKVEEGFYEEDKQLKSDFIDLIGSFVKTGNPNYGLEEKTNIVWPPFDTDKKSYLSFSLYPSVREDVQANRRYIWDTLVPKWIQESQVQQGKQEL